MRGAAAIDTSLVATKVDEIKASVEKLHFMCKTEDGEKLLNEIASASEMSQTLVVLYAAWAQLMNSNFGKECEEGKLARKQIYDMKDILNSEAIRAVDDKFWTDISRVMTSRGYEMEVESALPAGGGL